MSGEDDKTYKIRLFFSDINKPAVDAQGKDKRGLSLEEAQEFCKDPESSSATCTSATGQARTLREGDWFYGYTEE